MEQLASLHRRQEAGRSRGDWGQDVVLKSMALYHTGSQTLIFLCAKPSTLTSALGPVSQGT